MNTSWKVGPRAVRVVGAVGLAATLLIPGPITSAVPATDLPGDDAPQAVELALRRLVRPPGTIVWDEHRDAIGDQVPCFDGAVSISSPELVESAMMVFGDDAFPGWNQMQPSAILGFVALTDVESFVYGATVYVLIDTTGDDEDDFRLAIGAGSDLNTRFSVPVERWTGEGWEDVQTQPAWVVRWAYGFGATFDYRELGMTAARFKFDLFKQFQGRVPCLHDLSPDEYVGELIPLPQAPLTQPGPPSAVLGNLSPPQPPVSAQAVPGDESVVVTWIPGVFGAGNPIGSMVAAVPLGHPDPSYSLTCYSIGTSCTFRGLANQQAYSISVIAQSHSGSSVPLVLPPVTPKPFVKIKLKAKKKASVLFVNINPNLKKRRYWRFRVEKQVSDGSWAALPKTYRSKGRKEVRTINLRRGTYRVVVLPKHGHQLTVSAKTVTLRR